MNNHNNFQTGVMNVTNLLNLSRDFVILLGIEIIYTIVVFKGILCMGKNSVVFTFTHIECLPCTRVNETVNVIL